MSPLLERWRNRPLLCGVNYRLLACLQHILRACFDLPGRWEARWRRYRGMDGGRDEPLDCSQAGTDVTALPRPLRKQAPLSGVITAFMMLEFKPTHHQNNNSCIIGQEQHHIALFSFSTVKTGKQEKNKRILMGLLSQVSTSIMTSSTL